MTKPEPKAQSQFAAEPALELYKKRVQELVAQVAQATTELAAMEADSTYKFIAKEKQVRALTHALAVVKRYAPQLEYK
jgi:hypothetical protein